MTARVERFRQLVRRTLGLSKPSQPTLRSGVKCKWTRCGRPWNGGRLLCCDMHEDMTLDMRAEADE